MNSRLAIRNYLCLGQATSNMYYFFSIIVVLSLLLCTILSTDNSLPSERKQYDDEGLNVLQIIEKYGYPLEVHDDVKTKDGYLLQLHRIPHGKNDVKRKRPVVLLAHCLLCSSAEFIYFGPERSLGFILADEGYDVWLANNRGNTWSKKHATLQPNTSSEYWDFSFHELGMFDYPAIIDYIRDVTKQEKIHVLGHSQGGGSMLITLSELPEYNQKVHQLITFAPGAYLAGGSFTRMLTSVWPSINNVLSLFGINEFLPKGQLLPALSNTFCKISSWTLPLCLEFLYAIVGKNEKQFDKGSVPTIVSSTPAGCSRKQINHLLQLTTSERFSFYDYGDTENLKRYNSTVPPEYNIKNVKAPTSVFYGKGDTFIGLPGIQTLGKNLPNLDLFKMVEDDKWTHLDFLWAIRARSLLYNDVVKLLRRFDI